MISKRTQYTTVFTIIMKTVDTLTKFLQGVNTGKNQKQNNKNLGKQVFLETVNKGISVTKKFLKDNPDLFVINADKSNKSVIITEEMYHGKMMELLSDKKVYKQINRDLSNTQQLKNNLMVNNWLKSKFISKETQERLIMKEALPPKIYGLIKLHKNGNPIRPIVSCIQSPFYKMSGFLGKILSNIVGQSKYHVKDSFHFQKFIKHQTVPNDFMLVSLDVISLYTNIPIDLALKVVGDNWSKIEKLTKLPKKEFLYGVEVCLRSTFFQFEDLFFQQVSGLAMGGPISAVIANLVLESAEKELMSTLPFKCIFYKRFVDDCLLCVPKSKGNMLLHHFNSFHNSIQFTLEEEVDKTINFLDLTIDHLSDGKIMTKWYQKPTHSGRYLHYFSDAPYQHKLNVVKNLANRVVTLTDFRYQAQSIDKAKTILGENGYPETLLNKIFKNELAKRRFGRKENVRPKFDLDKAVKLPYIPGLAEKFKFSFKQTDIKPIFTNSFTNKKLFTNLKSKTPTEKESSVVYEINCKDCDKSYIGQTKRYLQERIKSHKYDKKEKTALHKHMEDTGHIFDFENPRVLAKEKNRQARLVLEAIHIKKKKSSAINFRTDADQVSSRYDCFFA